MIIQSINQFIVIYVNLLIKYCILNILLKKTDENLHIVKWNFMKPNYE